MTRHVEAYVIQWATHSFGDPIRYNEGEKSYQEDCWEHNHTYVYWTKPHEDDECPPLPEFEKSEPWCVEHQTWLKWCEHD